MCITIKDNSYFSGKFWRSFSEKAPRKSSAQQSDSPYTFGIVTISHTSTLAMPLNINLECRHLGEFSFFSPFILEKKTNTQLGKKKAITSVKNQKLSSQTVSPDQVQLWPVNSNEWYPCPKSKSINYWMAYKTGRSDSWFRFSYSMVWGS